MRLWELESALTDLKSFESPNAALEQYTTSGHLAARFLHAADFQYGDIADRVVLDLGTGCGTLALGAALLNAAHVLGVDVDSSALSIASSNRHLLQVNNTVDLARIDVLDFLPATACWAPSTMIDTVIMNPPFGTKRKGVDIAFLQVAVAHAQKSVYSLHKTSTRGYIDRKAREWNARAEVLAQMHFDIPSLYSFHTRKSVDVEVDCWRLDVTACDQSLRDSLMSNSLLMNAAEEASLPTRCLRGNSIRGKSRRRR